MVCASIAVVLAFAALAPGGTIRHDVSDQEYLDLAADPAFDTVGKFVVQTTSGAFLSSGTVIDPWWVLTAAHVVDNATGVSFTVNGVVHAGDVWAVHEDWNTNDVAAGFDLAVVKLTVPTGLTPSELYTGTSELGLVGTAVGYGRTGTGLTGDTGSSGTKRAGENMIDVLAPLVGRDRGRIFKTDFDNPDDASESSFGSSTPLGLEYMVAPGDSGGGLFVDDGSGYKIAGVTSYVWQTDGDPDSDYGDGAGFTRVSKFVTWIADAISSTTAPLPGDANLDGSVDLSDFNILKSAFATSGNWTNGDFNGDGLVGLDDFVILKDNFTGAAVIPEPGSLLLIAVGAMWTLAHRSRVRK